MKARTKVYGPGTGQNLGLLKTMCHLFAEQAYRPLSKARIYNALLIAYRSYVSSHLVIDIVSRH